MALIFHRSGTLLRRFMHGPGVDQILSEEIVNGAGEVHWTLSDNQGTIRDRVTYDHATLTSRRSAHFVFDSFGNVVSETDPVTGVVLNPATQSRSLNHQNGPMFAFTGREWDSDVVQQRSCVAPR